FTGRENDRTGLYFYRARYYDPKTQRFLSEDPIGSGVNSYAYVDNRPTQGTDPLGLQTLNNSPYPVWYKPEHGEEPRCIPPGQFDPSPEDGIAIPDTHPGQVYKNPSLTGVVVDRDGSVTTVAPPPNRDFPFGPGGPGSESPIYIPIPKVPGAATG